MAGKTASYYDLTAGSVGFQIGGDTKDIVIMFMTDSALKQSQVNKEWVAGVGVNIALANSGGCVLIKKFPR